mgnify:FL=1
MKKRIVSLALTVILLLAVPLTASADFDPETRNSVVVVETCLELDAGTVSFGWGTGFFVGEEGQDPMYLITNHHVIEPFLESGEGELVQAETTEGVLTGRSKIRVFYDSDDFEEAYPVAYDEIKDLAVLKLGAATSKRTPLPLCSPTDNMVGSTIYAVGYPGLAENVFADATTTWGPSDVSVTSGSISRLLTTSGTGQMRLQIDCVIRHGNSGGPLVNEDGQVLGIAVSSVSDEEDSSMYYGVNIDEVIPYLKQYDVPYVLQEAGATQSSSETSLAEGTAPAGDTIVVPESTEEDPKESSGGVPAAVWVVIGVAVAAVAGVVIFLLLQKGKKTPAQVQPVQPAPAPAPAPQKVPVLRSLAQQHNGVRIPIQGRQILIGTSQGDCQVVFRSGTPGVSRRHCSISWDAATGDFILTDLGSSFGTFLENRQKLAQGVPTRLRPGDRFYLGSPENLLSTGLE